MVVRSLFVDKKDVGGPSSVQILMNLNASVIRNDRNVGGTKVGFDASDIDASN